MKSIWDEKDFHSELIRGRGERRAKKVKKARAERTARIKALKPIPPPKKYWRKRVMGEPSHAEKQRRKREVIKRKKAATGFHATIEAIKKKRKGRRIGLWKGF